MLQNQYYILLISILVLTDIVTWLRIVRLPRGRRAPQIVGAIFLAIAVVVSLNLWLMGGR